VSDDPDVSGDDADDMTAESVIRGRTYPTIVPRVLGDQPEA
jgi:hypothetical protein